MMFVARIGTPEGRVVEEQHSAPDERALRAELERRGVHIFEIKSRGVSVRSLVPTKVRRARVKDAEFLIFNQELAALLRAGLPLLQALDLMLKRMPQTSLRAVLEDIRDRVRTGQDLSDAVAHHADVFPRLYPSILKAGERSGELEQVIRRFIRYLRLVLDARKRVTSALVYPTVLVTLSVVMILIMVTYVIPKFQVFFEASEVQLPWITRTLIAIGVFVQTNWWLLLIGLVVGWVSFNRWRRSEPGALALDRFQLQLPLMGGVLHRFALSEFSRSLATLLAGGMPLVPALEISVEAVGNTHIRTALAPTIQHVREGEAFHHALEKTGTFTELAIDMVQVGEATGALDEMLNSVSDFFDEQVETRMQRILSLIEPLMLVFMGVVIAVILISLYLPLFSALSQVKS